MCNTVIFARSGIECDTVKELKEALPDLELVKSDSYDKIDDGRCLCQIDLDTTFDNAKLNYTSRSMTYTLIDI